MPRERTPVEASKLVELVRDRTEAAVTERAQWRRARMNDDAMAKAW